MRRVCSARCCRSLTEGLRSAYPPRAAPALAQGSDDCAAATAITGNGPFSCDTTTATTDGLADPVCGFFGNLVDTHWERLVQLDRDPRGRRTPSTCATCSVTTTKAAVYDGGCGTTVTWCNDGLRLEHNGEVVSTRPRARPT